MRNLLLILMCTCASVSCKPLQESFETKQVDQQQKYDSVRVVEKLRYVPVPVKGDTVKVRVQLPCPDSAKTSGEVKNGRTRLTYKLHNGLLDLDCNSDSLLLEIWARDTEVERLRIENRLLENSTAQVKIVTEKVKVFRTPLWAWIAMAVMLVIIFRAPIKKAIVNLFYKIIPVPWR